MDTNVASNPFDVSDSDGADLNMIAAVTINPTNGTNSTGKRLCERAFPYHFWFCVEGH